MMPLVDIVARTIVAAFAWDIVAAAALALGVWYAIRMGRPSATTQHALWWIVLCAAAALPVASIATSFARVEHLAARSASSSLADRARVAAVASKRDASPNTSSDARTASTPSEADVSDRIADVIEGARRTARLPGLATAIVALFFLVAAVRTVALGRGLLELLRIKRDAIELDENVLRRLRRCRYGMRTGRAVRILLTERIDVPVAVGFGAPAILLPAPVAEHETIADLDQIVMHEYAHLNRYDDVTNLVQCVLEALFWFNPVLAFVGRRISLQREIACDDAVVAQTGRAHRYATCLWRLVESARLPSRRITAPAALFTPKQITTRIEQLLDSERNAMPRLSPLSAIAVAAVSAALVFAVAGRAPAIALEDRATATLAADSASNLAIAPPQALPSPVPRIEAATRAYARATELRIGSDATPEAIANAVIDATMKRSMQLEKRDRTRVADLTKAAASLGTGVGLDIARTLSEKLAPASERPQIERSLTRAKDRAQRELADAASDRPTGGVRRSLSPFHRILVEGSYDVEIRSGSHAFVDFQNDTVVASHTYTDVSRGTLTIEQSDGSYETVAPKTILVYVPSFDDVEIDGSANVRAPNVTGAKLSVRISGSGDFSANGSIGNADVTIEGSGDADLLGLHAVSMNVTTEGSGDIKLAAPSTLNVRIEGSGGVTMRGTPKHITSEVDGSGSIDKI